MTLIKKYSDDIKSRFTARHQKSINFIGDVKGFKILNIGSYNGWLERGLSEKGAFEASGIDIEDCYVLASKKNAPKARIEKMSVLDLMFKENYFDIVVFFDVIEHIPKGTEEKAISEIKKVLKKGGVLFLSTPNKNFFSCLLDPAWYFGHRHYKIGYLISLLKNHGFKVEKYEIKGGFAEQISMIMLYFFKYVFKRESFLKPVTDFFRNKEYLSKKTGFVTTFIKAKLYK
jgi:SAM-dependent methyltransferase